MKQLNTSRDFFGLAIEKLQSKKFQSAIEAFNKSLALHEDWESYKGLGSALFNTQQYQSAIEAFNKSLALKEDWHSYQRLGSSLFNTQQYQSAIEAFNKSLALKEDWHSYQRLGSALFNTQQYQSAIEAFNKSLALKEDWHSYQRLGSSLFNTQQYQSAIEAFNKSLALKEDWHSYLGLGWSLIKTQQHKEGLEQFYRSYECEGDINWSVLHDLGSQLIKQNHPDLAIDFFQGLMKKYPDELLTVCSFVSMVKKLNLVSEYQDLFTQLEINRSWDLVEFYEKNIKNKLFYFKDANSMRFAKDRLVNAKYVNNRKELWYEAIRNMEVNDGLIMEFGVRNGYSISFIANILSHEEVHGFDSFEGLPEEWSSKTAKPNEPRGGLSRGGHLPAVPKNVRLHKGWFENTLPLFLRSYPDKNSSLIHIDSDIYSSAKTVLFLLAKTIIPGTIIIFDEYYNYSGWEDHEFKAFQEFVKEYALTYEYISYTHEQVSIRILSKNK